MITLVYPDPSTNEDVSWSISLREHSPYLEKRTVVTADAGDYIAPDVVEKGSYDFVTITTNPIPSSEISDFYAFREGSKGGAPVSIDATNVLIIGEPYIGIREGSLIPKSLHGGRYFSFSMTLRVIGTGA